MKKNIFWLLLIALIGLGNNADAQAAINFGNTSPVQAFWQYLGVHCAGLDAIEMRILRLDSCADLQIENLAITPHGSFPNCVIVPTFKKKKEYDYEFSQEPPAQSGQIPTEAKIWAYPMSTTLVNAEELKAQIKKNLMEFREIVIKRTQQSNHQGQNIICTCDQSGACAADCACKGMCSKESTCACKGKCSCEPDVSSTTREGCVDFDVAVGENFKPLTGEQVLIEPSNATFYRVVRKEEDPSRDEATCTVKLTPVPGQCLSAGSGSLPTSNYGPSAPEDDTHPPTVSLPGLLDTIQIPSPCLCVPHPDSIIANVLDGLYRRDLDTITPYSKLQFFQVTLTGDSNYRFTLNPAFDGEIAAYSFTNPDDYNTYTPLIVKDFGVAQPFNFFDLLGRAACETLRVVIAYHPCDTAKLDVKIEKKP